MKSDPGPDRQVLWIAILGAAALGVAVWAVAWFSPTPNASFRDAAGILGLVSATALGIERVIEAGWTILGGAVTAGRWFGFGAAAKQAETRLAEIDKRLAAEFFSPVSEILSKASERDLTSDATKALEMVKDQRAALERNLSELRALAPSDEKATAIVATAQRAIQFVNLRYGDLDKRIQTSAAAAEQSLLAISALVNTFTDNPAKRLISLYASVLLGLVVSAFTGADLFSAALAATPESAPGGAKVGVILSGFVMGLGAAPTHEVIKILQGIKRGQFETVQSAPATPGRQIMSLDVATGQPVESGRH